METWATEKDLAAARRKRVGGIGLQSTTGASHYSPQAEENLDGPIGPRRVWPHSRFNHARYCFELTRYQRVILPTKHDRRGRLYYESESALCSESPLATGRLACSEGLPRHVYNIGSDQSTSKYGHHPEHDHTLYSRPDDTRTRQPRKSMSSSIWSSNARTCNASFTEHTLLSVTYLNSGCSLPNRSTSERSRRSSRSPASRSLFSLIW